MTDLIIKDLIERIEKLEKRVDLWEIKAEFDFNYWVKKEADKFSGNIGRAAMISLYDDLVKLRPDNEGLK